MKKKILKIIYFFIISLIFTSCKNYQKNIKSVIDVAKIENIFNEEYSANKEKKISIKNVIFELGKLGYTAVDSENKFDMTNIDEVLKFIDKQQKGKKASIQILRVLYHNDFIVYEIRTDKHEVYVQETYFLYEDNKLKKFDEEVFTAKEFEFTNESYIFISGFKYSKEQYVLTLSDEEVHLAFRVYPLDNKCRELCDKYIMPVSYGLNNLFIKNWNNTKYTKNNAIDFYDIFDKFYLQKNDLRNVFNKENYKNGKYEIPAKEFEKVIKEHIEIEKEELQKLLRYDYDKNIYIYKQRGFGEFDYCDIPYPEVQKYEIEKDEITLYVNAVYPLENTSKLFSHKVVIKEDGNNWYYISNEIFDEDDINFWWHSERLLDEEKNELSDKGYNLVINQMEKQEIENDTKKIFDLMKNIYEPQWDEIYKKNNIDKNGLNEIVDMLFSKEYIVKQNGIYENFRNYEKIDNFLNNSKNNIEGEIVLYEIYDTYSVKRSKYVFDGLDMYVLTSKMTLMKNGQINEVYCKNTRIKTWRYTKSGWFRYMLCVPEYPEVTEMIDGSVLIRVKPISDEYRKASEKYLFKIGYSEKGLLSTNWDLSNLNEIDYVKMYKSLYYIDTGKKFNLPINEEGIPVSDFEALILKYIPTTKDVIRKNVLYDKSKNIYCLNKFNNEIYTPTFFDTSYPEVINIKNNADGSITLTVNAVCEMVLNNEAIISHEICIKNGENGSFQYLGNLIKCEI